MQLRTYFCPWIFTFGHIIGVLKSPALFQEKELQVARFKFMAASGSTHDKSDVCARFCPSEVDRYNMECWSIQIQLVKLN